jgi:hypothetical protein
MDVLDRRQLLSGLWFMHPTVYPLGTIGPLPAGSRLAAAGEVVHPYAYSAPTWYVSGQGMDRIVGSLIAGVDSNSQGSIITDVKYSVNGALGDTTTTTGPGQVWTTTTGSFARTTGIDHNFAGSPVSGDGWKWMWDETGGNRTIEVEATLKDGSQFVGTDDNMPVSTVQPAFFQVQVAKASMGYYTDGATWGL